ncbi:MAG: hypothetical protein DBX63_10480 [Clostridia bacterium]|nr:MAG: hypothetical protein DBX63_10480 [Clostridia bacterium]
MRKTAEPESVRQDRKTNEQTAFGLGRMPLLDFGREILLPLSKARKRIICVVINHTLKKYCHGANPTPEYCWCVLAVGWQPEPGTEKGRVSH